MSSRIWAWIVTSSAVVGSSAMSSSGFGDEGHRDHHPLAHAARQLVRVARPRAPASGMPTCSSISTARSQRLAAGDLLVEGDGLGDLVADGEDRVERGHRLLEDHRDRGCRGPRASRPRRGPAGSGRRAGSRPPTIRPGPVDEAHDGQRGDALAAAGLADHAQGLAVADLEAHAVDRPDDPVLGEEVGPQALDLEKVFGGPVRGPV